MSGLKNKHDNLYQSAQGVPERGVMAYDGTQKIEQPNDMVDYATVIPLKDQLAELLPPDALTLENKTLTLGGTVRRAGYLSADALATYAVGAGAGSAVAYIVNTGNCTLNIPDASASVNAGDKGVLTVLINDVVVDSFDLGARFDEALRDTAQENLPATSTNGKITVKTIIKHEIKLWQRVNFSVNLASADFVRGYNKVSVTHTDTNEGTQTSATDHFFYDMGVVNPTVEGVGLRVQSANASKWLSGVRFLSTTDTVTASFTGQMLFNNTYHAQPVVLSGLCGVSTATVAPDDAAVSGVETPPRVGDTMLCTEKPLVLAIANRCTANGRVTAKPQDPHGAYTSVLSPGLNILMSTFGQRSTDSAEQFDDEHYRLPLTWNPDDTTSPVTGNWDSTAALGANDAQLYVLAENEHGLRYPAEDYTGYIPANTANYNGTSGDVEYQRCFVISQSDPRSNMELTLPGLSGGLGQVGSGDVNVQIRIPTQTAWLDAVKPFDGSKGVNADGDGCLVGDISYAGGNAVIGLTFGGKSSFDSNGRCLVRVTLRNNTRTAKSMTTNW